MTAGVLIVSPLFPPARGGLADHTQRLAHQLAGELPAFLLTSRGAEADAACEVHPVVAGWRDAVALARAVEGIAPSSVVVWQYVPHMYGRGGVNPALPRAMAALRARRRRQIVIAHEIAAPFSPWPHRCWYALAQRWQWRQILSCADAVGFSTEAWLADWRRRAPGHAQRFFLFPSPSNIPVVAVPSAHAHRWRQERNLSAGTRVLLYFGTSGRAKQFSWLTNAWRRAQGRRGRVALVVVGDRPRFDPPAGLKALFKPLGYLPAAEVSAVMQAADLLALPFVDGVSERRTTFMTGLSHGCAVLTTVGPNTGPTLRQADFCRATPVAAPGSFTQAVSELLADDWERERLGVAGRQAYAQQYDWPVVARTLRERAEALEGGSLSGSGVPTRRAP